MISYIVTSDEIVLYWEKETDLPEGFQYRVFLNGNKMGSTTHTHYTLSGLKPDTTYKVSVFPYDEYEITTAKEKRRLDITKAPYGAVGDGKYLNTQKIQQAIDDCTKEDVVYIPKGIFMTGALRFHSNMEMYLEEGAVLQGTDRREDYLPKIWSRFEGTELSCYSSLITMGDLDHNAGYNCTNVMIHGKGTIFSGGKALAEEIIAYETENLKEELEALGDGIKECEKPETIPGRVRPRLIQMNNCKNVVLKGLTLGNGASWNVHMIYSDEIITTGCTFHSENVWNGDGWDPDSSTNCTLFDCEFYTGDDSVAIKSGKNPEGNVINRPTEHIRIFDCISHCGNGIAMGSEMSGGINDVKIWDCDLSSSTYGIEIKGTSKRGGYVKNIHVSDCKVARVMFHAVGYNNDGIGAKEPPVFENCSFRNLEIAGKYFTHEKEWKYGDAIELCGFEEKGFELRNIRFKDITIGTEGESRPQKLSLQLCRNISFEGIRCL